MKLRLATDDDRNRIWFRAISDHVYRVAGIHLHAENRTIYERRVSDVVHALRLSHLRDYYMRLVYHPHGEAMTQQLIEAITTGETYFYRESRQLSMFFDHVLPTLRALRSGGPVRIWSIGCSSGEEPYSLAMMAHERGIPADDISVIGGDINRRALAAARDGIYRESAFRVTPAHWRDAYFTREPDGRWRLNDTIRRYVSFAWVNLMSKHSLDVIPEPHAIFCRNVLIYFDRWAKSRAIANLHHALVPGGALLLGHAESLLHLEHAFAPEHTSGDIVYRKLPR